MNPLLFLQDTLDQWITHAAGCWSKPWGALECQPFWNWVAIGSIATGILTLLAVNLRNIQGFFKNRAASTERNGSARAWDGVERRGPRSQRRIAHEKKKKKFAWAGHAEIRSELDRRMSERRKFEPDKTNPRGLAYDQIRDRLDEREIPTIPPWASKGKSET